MSRLFVTENPRMFAAHMDNPFAATGGCFVSRRCRQLALAAGSKCSEQSMQNNQQRTVCPSCNTEFPKPYFGTRKVNCPNCNTSFMQDYMIVHKDNKNCEIVSCYRMLTHPDDFALELWLGISYNGEICYRLLTHPDDFALELWFGDFVQWGNLSILMTLPWSYGIYPFLWFLSA
eukprot:g10589.t1